MYKFSKVRKVENDGAVQATPANDGKEEEKKETPANNAKEDPTTSKGPVKRNFILKRAYTPADIDYSTCRAYYRHVKFYKRPYDPASDVPQDTYYAMTTEEPADLVIQEQMANWDTSELQSLWVYAVPANPTSTEKPSIVIEQ